MNRALTTASRHPFAFALLWGIAVSAGLLLSALNLYFGEINQDEGWYLYAARLISEGQLPYVDFASTQGPVMPFVYAVAWAPLQGWGVAGGRLVTACLGFCCALAAAALAARLAGRDRHVSRTAALVAFTLIAVNVFQSYFFTMVKTYALGGFLLTLGFLALNASSTRESLRGRRLHALGAGVCLALAAATRVSLGAVLPIVFVGMLAARYLVRDRSETRTTAHPWWFAMGAGAVLAVCFVPFRVMAPRALWFALVEYHAGRQVDGVAINVAYKLGFLSRVVRAYFVPVGLTLLLLLRAVSRPRPLSSAASAKEDPTADPAPVSRGIGTVRGGPPLALRSPQGEGGTSDLRPPLLLLWLSVLAVSLVHLLAPFPYDDYQAVILPLFAVGVAVWLADAFAGSRAEGPNGTAVLSGPGLAAAVLLLSLFSAFSSSRCQDWFTGPRDRIWWPLREKAPVALMREAGAAVRTLAGEGGELLTQDTYLAVESGLRLPRGLEMGPFSYFPDWPREKAQACHVLNEAMLVELLETTEAPVAAFSAYGFAIASPGIERVPDEQRDRFLSILARRYTPAGVIANFGQAETELRIYRRRP